jgi:dolichol-phosphate mannosyltransferase
MLTTLVLWPGFRDWTSGFIAVRADVVKTIKLKGDYGEYFIKLMYTLLRDGHRVLEIPYHLVPRRFGESKTATNLIGFIRRGVKYIYMVFQLKFSE